MDGVGLIQAERERQKNVEGWTPEHDDEHIVGQMIVAAEDYVSEAKRIMRGHDARVMRDGAPWGWPWEPKSWKPSPDPIRNLVKAGALIAAEIDRLQRLANASVTSSPEQEAEIESSEGI